MENYRIDFDCCPNCGATDTVCRLACEGERGIPEGTFVSMEKVVTPIVVPQKVPGLTMPALICHLDICAKCGTRYCTRVERQNIPITFQQAPGRQPPFYGGPPLRG